MTDTLTRLYEAGCHFIPTNKDKTPATPGSWQDTANQITVEQVRKRIKSGLSYGVIPPANMIVIDLDRHPGKGDGIKDFQDLKAKNGITKNYVKETLIVKTQGGGFHAFFQL